MVEELRGLVEAQGTGAGRPNGALTRGGAERRTATGAAEVEPLNAGCPAVGVRRPIGLAQVPPSTVASSLSRHRSSTRRSWRGWTAPAPPAGTEVAAHDERHAPADARAGRAAIRSGDGGIGASPSGDWLVPPLRVRRRGRSPWAPRPRAAPREVVPVRENCVSRLERYASACQRARTQRRGKAPRGRSAHRASPLLRFSIGDEMSEKPARRPARPESYKLLREIYDDDSVARIYQDRLHDLLYDLADHARRDTPCGPWPRLRRRRTDVVARNDRRGGHVTTVLERLWGARSQRTGSCDRGR